MSEQINIDELERTAAQAAGPQLGGANFTMAELKFRATFDPMTVLTLINQLRALGDRAMHLERRLSDVNGEVLRLQGADQHALRLQAGHDEAVLKIDEARQRATDAEQIATARGHTINGLRNELQAVKVERDELAAKLKELEGQEPITVEWPTYPYESMVSGLEERGVAGHYDAMLYGWERGVKQVVGALPDSLFYARPVPAEHPTPATRPGWRDINDIVADREKDPSKAAALERARERLAAESAPVEPVNARLLAAAKAALDALTCSGEPDDPGHRCGHCDDYVDRNGVVRSALRDAISAAEAQQTEPVRLTRESVARAIWGVRREYEDRCDMELEDMGESHPVWDEADAVLAAAELTQTDPTWLTIEQARNAERYAYLRSQHEGSVAASFAVFAPEQPIGEFGPVGSMPGELDAAIDSAMRADSHKVEG